MSYSAGDKVLISVRDGIVGQGVIANINDFRESSQKYAIDLVGYDDDYIFVGEENLEPLMEVPQEYIVQEYKDIAELAETEGLAYSITEGYIDSTMTHDAELKISIDTIKEHMLKVENILADYIH